DDALCVVLGQPNVFGVVEDLADAAAAAHAVGALAISATAEPLALALVRPPGACGIDIAVAEGQSFGLPVSYGGPGGRLLAQPRPSDTCGACRGASSARRSTHAVAGATC